MRLISLSVTLHFCCEALNLVWGDIFLTPANGSHFGYIRVREGKTRNARRNVPITERVRVMLDERMFVSNISVRFF